MQARGLADEAGRAPRPRLERGTDRLGVCPWVFRGGRAGTPDLWGIRRGERSASSGAPYKGAAPVSVVPGRFSGTMGVAVGDNILELQRGLRRRGVPGGRRAPRGILP